MNESCVPSIYFSSKTHAGWSDSPLSRSVLVVLSLAQRRLIAKEPDDHISQDGLQLCRLHCYERRNSRGLQTNHSGTPEKLFLEMKALLQVKDSSDLSICFQFKTASHFSLGLSETHYVALSSQRFSCHSPPSVRIPGVNQHNWLWKMSGFLFWDKVTCIPAGLKLAMDLRMTLNFWPFCTTSEEVEYGCACTNNPGIQSTVLRSKLRTLCMKMNTLPTESHTPPFLKHIFKWM